MHGLLLGLDRGAKHTYALPALTVGAQPAAARGAGCSGPSGQCAQVRKAVDTEAGIGEAIKSAQAGDVIVLAPGIYRFSSILPARATGSAEAPITVKAERPGTATVEFDATEGFAVSGAYWRFENLAIHGVCTSDSRCEHAFHVTGDARHFAAVNNTIRDFNAHFKINGSGGRFPDYGLIERNTLSNSAPRRTSSPVTPIDLVAANGWTIRANLITDFVKDGGDRISYGAFAKGGAAGTSFDRNIVVCEQRLQGRPGQRVGISFGGGGTGKPWCRDARCITEHDHGIMRGNLVASCSDAGIYVNSAADTHIIHNTLLDTAGIDVRFPESAAEVIGNLVDGTIRTRNGARLRALDNLDTPIAYLYAGYHPVRRLFASSGELDLRWRGEPPRRAVGGRSLDLCGRARPVWASYGAFEDFAACL
jgi:Chondroitinase B